MDLSELKKLREKKILEHKRKKREYYLKSKANKTVRKVIDYEEELSDKNFAQKIKDIAKAQKAHVDDRKDLIVAKINDYRNKKREYYEENKEKRLEYDKEYREKKKEQLREYRRDYYKKNKEKILAKQKEKKQTSNKE
jgi:hypothetical protein